METVAPPDRPASPLLDSALPVTGPVASDHGSDSNRNADRFHPGIVIGVFIGSAAQIQGHFAGPKELPTSIAATEGLRTINLDGLQARWDIPYRNPDTGRKTGRRSENTSHRELRMETDVAIRKGRLVVVGKAGLPTSAQGILPILRARLAR